MTGRPYQGLILTAYPAMERLVALLMASDTLSLARSNRAWSSAP